MAKHKTYKDSHKWITFSLDSRKFTPNIWLMMGEAQSKCEHVASIPLRPAVADKMYQLYLAKGVNATTAIEGNTLTFEEVQDRIEGKSELSPSREYLGLEVDNIVSACNSIMKTLLDGSPSLLTKEDVMNYNSMIFESLPLQDRFKPGEIRDYEVGVGGYVGVPASDCSFLVEELTDWINKDWGTLVKGYEKSLGVIKAIVSHIYFVWIHPFGDGNGRTARLIEFQILLSLGLPAASTHLLSNHYNQTRTEYYRHLEQASKNVDDGIYLFIEYALQGFVDGLREQIDKIKEQQLSINWINYIYEHFAGKKGIAHSRRKHLVLDLSYESKTVPLHEIRLISKRVMEEYGKVTNRTLLRDINTLENEGLIIRTKKGVRGNKEIMYSFQSPTAKPNTD